MSLIVGKRYLNRFRDSKMRIGIFGGSFNPIHQGHINVALSSIKMLGLDYLIMMVAYNNPYKPAYKKSVTERALEIQERIRHNKVLICTMEGELKHQFTYRSIKYLRPRLPHVSFFLIMGGDTATHFHKWEGRDIITKNATLAVFDRLQYTYKAAFSKTCCKMPQSVYRMKRSGLSSTFIRSLNKEEE